MVSRETGGGGRERIQLTLVLVLAAFLNFYRLNEPYYSLYYAAAVKSMLTSWHNFVFASFDPGGFVTTDKPPFALWVQAASAWLFGFSRFSLALPEALAGVLSTYLVYGLVAGSWGAATGLLAALLFAVTPVTVAVNRFNVGDGLLVCVLLLAAGAVVRACRSGRLAWLLGAGFLVGIGFNLKMGAAYVVLPALAALYLAAGSGPWWRRLGHLCLALLVAGVVSLAWFSHVDSVSPHERPYIDGSLDNSIVNLAIVYNGLDRLPPAVVRLLHLPQAQEQPPQPPAFSVAAPGLWSAAIGLHDPKLESGDPGAWRLFEPPLAGQLSWFLPLACLGLAVRRPGSREEAGALWLWAAWLIPQWYIYSTSAVPHRHYLALLSPAVAALAARAWTVVWDARQAGGWQAWLPVPVLVGNAAVAVLIVTPFPDWWALRPWIAACTVSACLLLVLDRRQPAALQAARVAGLAGLLIGPAVWGAIDLWADGWSELPFAGPDLLAARASPVPPGTRLERFLLDHRGASRFLVGVMKDREAAPLILMTGQPVMPLGGFSGFAPILTQEDLARKIRDGEIRYFFIPHRVNYHYPLILWILDNAEPVPDDQWQDDDYGYGGLPLEGMPPHGLYEVKIQ